MLYLLWGWTLASCSVCDCPRAPFIGLSHVAAPRTRLLILFPCLCAEPPVRVRGGSPARPWCGVQRWLRQLLPDRPAHPPGLCPPARAPQRCCRACPR